MAGYIYAVSRTPAPKDKSPIVDIITFKRDALELFDKTISNAKKAHLKLEDVVEYECPPFSECEKERQVMKKCVGEDKDGNSVAFFLERRHVGGQLEARRSRENGE
jgi:hypothetical protein